MDIYQAETRKLAKYKDLENSHIVLPVAIETLGGFGQSAWALTRALGDLLQATTLDKREATFLRQRIGVTVQIGNAACLAESMGLA